MLTPRETRERAIQVFEAFLYAVLAGVVSAILDLLSDANAAIDLHHLWEVARAAGVAAGVLYFKTKHRDPNAHTDRAEDTPKFIG